MFYELYKLTPKDGGGNRSTEDFTTAILANLLKSELDFAQSFYKLIRLPADNYIIRTQRRFSSKLGSTCIVDLVLESEDNICFIENKVESSEGNEQLERYIEVLSGIEKTSFLRYCTKYYEDKIITDHHFHQFTWHQLSKLLRQYPENYYITSFYKFLKKLHMADSYELTLEKLAAAKFMQDTLKTFEYYLKISKGDFESIFLAPGMSISKQEVTSGNSNRIGWKINGFDQNLSTHNELTFSIDFDTQVLNVHLYYHRNWQYENIFQQAEQDGFICSKSLFGVALHINHPLADFLNKEDPSNEIRQWYINAFDKMDTFVKRYIKIV